MLKSRQLKYKYAAFSNKELVKILRYRTDYTQDAVVAVQELLNQRALEQEELDQILDELNEEEQAERALDEESLSYWEKLLLICVPILGFVLYLVFGLKNRRITYTKKIARSLTYSLLGCIIFAVMLVVILYK